MDPDRVLDTFMADGRLTAIPRKAGKRRVVLDHIAQQFEIGRHYAEAEVNGILAAFHDDVAALRRYLVDSELLDRDAGEYWRAGGTVED
ncbi:MAG TPA: DUF2087 domain-containing protein [Acidimicrobiales bacterium]|nr:DUF2087 domain-containing protein [Acidimicrobiales bacterium]